VFDYFLSYNHSDYEAVSRIQELLAAGGAKTFFDRCNLAPGLAWPQALERALLNAKVVIVFVGPQGFGNWQLKEMYLALDLEASSQQRGTNSPKVVPLLLPGADPQPGFLFVNSPLDVRAVEPTADLLTPIFELITGQSALISNRHSDSSAVCPFRGLRSFREEDQAFYFGREVKVADLFNKITRERVVGVVGPSGTGKSSIAIAGLIPMVRRQRPPKPTWDIVTFRPGNRPWRRLAEALIVLMEPQLMEAEQVRQVGILATEFAESPDAVADAIGRCLFRSGGTDRLLIIIDQFEELLAGAAEKDSTRFVQSIMDATACCPVHLAFTLRADYFGHAILLGRKFSDALSRGPVTVDAMTEDELRTAIEMPAKVAGLTFETGLIDCIVADAGKEPGSLPLVEYCLTELFAAREGRVLTFRGYNNTGRVADSIGTRAEGVFASLSPADQRTCRHLATRLVRASAADQEGADTRERVTRDVVGPDAWRVAEQLAAPESRLLVLSRDMSTEQQTVEVAHEALIHRWDRMHQWVSEDREFLLWRQRLAVFLDEWEYSNRDQASLLRGGTLDEAKHWLGERGDEFNEVERDFIGKSAVASRRYTWLRRSVAAVLAALVVGTAGWFAYTRTTRFQIASIFNEPSLREITVASPSEWERFVCATAQAKGVEAALPLARRIIDPEERVKALAAAATSIQPSNAAPLLLEAHRVIEQTAEAESRDKMRVAVCDVYLKASQWENAIAEAREVHDQGTRERTMVEIVSTLAIYERWSQAEALARAMSRDKRDEALQKVVKYLADKHDWADAQRVASSIEATQVRLDAVEEIAKNFVQVGDIDRARQLWTEAERMAGSIADVGLKTSALETLANTIAIGHDVQWARLLLLQAMKTAGQIQGWKSRNAYMAPLLEEMVKLGSWREADRLLGGLAQDQRLQGFWQLHIATQLAKQHAFQEAREEALKIEARDTQLEALGAIASALADSGQKIAAIELLEYAWKEARHLRDRSQPFNVLQSLIELLIIDGKSERTSALLLEIEHPDTRSEILSHVSAELSKKHLSLLASHTAGQIADDRRRADAFGAIIRQLADEGNFQETQKLITLLPKSEGRNESLSYVVAKLAAGRRLEEAQQLANTISDTRARSASLGAIAVNLAALGRIREARQLADECLSTDRMKIYTAMLEAYR